ncbi:MAG TPA: 50S ribosomal protein L19 [Candidatus Sulfotelmatobacter sp.]|nr:50S ribosomal protein L19 [Candidatus Sulfotelmatobacter sp.]
MPSPVNELSEQYKKSAVVNVKSGDTVKVHQKIKEGNKERIQVFQGLVIKTSQPNSHMRRITVRRISSGVGVEKSFLLHSPLVVKVEVVKRSKVRRNYLSYMRSRTGKSARMTGVDFDAKAVNDVVDEAVEAEEEKIHQQKAEEAKAKAEEKAKEEEELAKKAAEVEARHHKTEEDEEE